VNQEKFARDILKQFKMKGCAKLNILVDCGVKMSKNDKGGKINFTTFKSLVRSLRYLTCTRPYILYGVGLANRFMETSTMTYFKALKRILRYIKGTIDFGLFYDYSNSFHLVGYSDSDWARDMYDKKSTTSFVFYMEDIVFT